MNFARYALAKAGPFWTCSSFLQAYNRRTESQSEMVRQALLSYFRGRSSIG